MNSLPSTSLVRTARRRAAPVRDRLAVVPDREADLGANDRLAAHRLQAMRQLGRLGLQELAPRRRAEEQLAHLDRRADAARRGLQLAGAGVEPGRVRGLGGAAGDRELGDRGDRRQRLAAKAERRHALELGERGDLAGGMAAQRQGQLGGGDAVAVVLDADRPHAAADQADDDLPGPGVDGVVEQLAHHRGRSLDDLAGGDLADQLARQFADRPAHAGLEDGVHRRIVGRPFSTSQSTRPRASSQSRQTRTASASCAGWPA